MAVRVTEAEVKVILDDTSLSDAIVLAYITSANIMVNAVLGTGPTDILKEIERWLAAHMIACTRERTAKKEGASGAFIEYTGEYGKNLSSTPYGQMVLSLDTTGAMAELAMQAVIFKAIESFT
jgi:hypothetical protein